MTPRAKIAVPPPAAPHEKLFLTTQEAANMMGVSAQVLRDSDAPRVAWTKRTIRWKLTDLMEWSDAKKKERPSPATSAMQESGRLRVVALSLSRRRRVAPVDNSGTLRDRLRARGMRPPLGASRARREAALRDDPGTVSGGRVASGPVGQVDIQH